MKDKNSTPDYIEKEDCKVHEKTMVDIKRIIKLRDQMRKAIEIQKEDEKRYKEGTPAHSYHLGGLHRLEEFESKINDLIILG